MMRIPGVFKCLLVVSVSSALQTALAAKECKKGDDNDSMVMIQTKVTADAWGMMEGYAEEAMNQSADGHGVQTKSMLAAGANKENHDLAELHAKVLRSMNSSVHSKAMTDEKTSKSVPPKAETLDRSAKHFNAPRFGLAIASLAIFGVVLVACCSYWIWLLCRSKKEEEKKKIEKKEDESEAEDDDQRNMCGLGFLPPQLQRITVGMLLSIVTLVLGYLALSYSSGVLLKHFVEKFDMAFLGVHVTMQEVDLNPFTGALSIEALEVSNPAGYHTDHLLRAKSLFVNINMLPLVLSLFNHIEVDAIKLSGVHAIYERALTTSNVDDFLNHLRQDKKAQATVASRKVVIHEVLVTDSWVKGTLHWATNHGVSLTVPDIHYTDFDKEIGAEGVDTIIDLILASLLKSILRVVSKSTSGTSS